MVVVSERMAVALVSETGRAINWAGDRQEKAWVPRLTLESGLLKRSGGAGS